MSQNNQEIPFQGRKPQEKGFPKTESHGKISPETGFPRKRDPEENFINVITMANAVITDSNLFFITIPP